MSLPRLLAVAVLACLPLLAGAKTLRYASQDDPQTLDPHSANLLATSRLTANVYEPLVWRDREWKVIPWLATSWTQPNDRTWRFRLREGVKFHDGSPFTADDVVFSVERALSPTSLRKVALQGVEKAVKVDAFTVDLVMRKPNLMLLSVNQALAKSHRRSCRQQALQSRRGLCRSRNSSQPRICLCCRQ